MCFCESACRCSEMENKLELNRIPRSGEEPAVLDSRPREVKHRHIVFDATPEQVMAWNLGVLYAQSGEKAIPNYTTSDGSREAFEFWEGVNWANPHVVAALEKKLDDLFGPENEGAQQHG